MLVRAFLLEFFREVVEQSLMKVEKMPKDRLVLWPVVELSRPKIGEDGSERAFQQDSVYFPVKVIVLLDDGNRTIGSYPRIDVRKQLVEGERRVADMRQTRPDVEREIVPLRPVRPKKVGKNHERSVWHPVDIVGRQMAVAKDHRDGRKVL